jgi:peptidoglycan-associated lipoprotein
MRITALTATFSRVAALAVPIALAACASKPLPAPAPPPAPVAAAPAPRVAAPAPMAAPPAEPLAAYLDPNNPVSQKRSVYFDFDAASFHAEDKAVIELQGTYLAQHPDVHVQVAGNTDERGGSEYNLALGQRRAQAVKSALEVLGVKDGQVEPISFGKEKPKDAGHDEAAWAQNRRADVVYPMH